MVQSVPIRATLQPAQVHTAFHVETRPPPPILSFLLAQNLSSEQILATDSVWPKSNDAKWCHSDDTV